MARARAARLASPPARLRARLRALLVSGALAAAGVAGLLGAPGAQPPEPAPGIERLDPALDRLVAPDARVEILASGFEWSEGPVWVSDGGFLLFSDVPRNVIYRWTPAEGARPWLTPSGYTGSEPRGGEMGSNGLVLDPRGRLVICQHGDRRVARMEAPLDDPRPVFATLADRYDGARFNSPNDAVFHSRGDLYFTDPPYGLERQAEDPRREIPFQGIYRVTPAGEVTLLSREMSRPNGLAFSPDERYLYVANSDPAAPHWRAFEVRPDGTLGPGRVLFDATALARRRPGLPDGLKVDERGHLFAAGPGGVLVISPAGRHLGTILTGQATANCAFGDADGRSLYITADMHLMRVRLRTRGADRRGPR
ncbi:MAG TPA: SMP-30/gluconolactonase/LRE family protein [Vicinamibacterales bacterium]|nr:SMP-30/gluconolactonase/LRE family protein [Vicinamibacterales bacterium]